MIKNIINKKSVVVVVVVSIILCMGFTAFANKVDTYDGKKLILNKKTKTNFNENRFKQTLENLVKEKKITEKRSIEINEEFNKEYNQRKSSSNSQKNNRKCKRCKIYSIINSLNKKEVITDKEADAIKAELKEARKQRFNQALEELVNKNVITKAKSKEIQEYMNKYRAEEFSKFKNMTKEERRSYFKENRKNKKSIVTKMIEDNVISEEQGEEMRKILRKNRNKK